MVLLCNGPRGLRATPATPFRHLLLDALLRHVATGVTALTLLQAGVFFKFSHPDFFGKKLI